MLRRREQFRQLAFPVAKEKMARSATALLEIDMDVVSEMIKKFKDTKRYKATTEAEKHINHILAELQSFGDKLHGTTAQMLDMRNEIRGYVNAFHMYTLFVTVNPADLHSPTSFSTKQIPFRPTTKSHLIPGCLAPKSLSEVPISQRQLRPLLIADFGERAMWVPGADDHMRTQTRPGADCDMGDVEDLNLCIYTPALDPWHVLD
ncbi:BQ5605_C007g04862 [Microbotryum silenes-dioicae]|uniref:BQ5605_C007g04862 protein n=1 Tax=Microbotryum silenes-dioicae TaxID=796604 RepID=A0A2X0PAJ1_9BASI|nr:BQ5605_C007g04862 [Microbotryum silenes-dioicae]